MKLLLAGITSPGGNVVGVEVTCGGDFAGGESFWWRDDRKPRAHMAIFCNHSSKHIKVPYVWPALSRCLWRGGRLYLVIFLL